MATATKTTGSTTTGPQTTSTSGYVPTTTSGGAVVGGTSRVPTYTSEFQQPDPTYSQFVTNTVFQNLMGRDASKDEVAYYHNLFTEYAKTHPIFTRTATYDVGSGVMAPSKDVTAQKTPLVEQDFISNLVRQTGDAKAYQAATSYFDVMKSAMNDYSGGY